MLKVSKVHRLSNSKAPCPALRHQRDHRLVKQDLEAMQEDGRAKRRLGHAKKWILKGEGRED